MFLKKDLGLVSRHILLKDPMNSALTVRPSVVCKSVCNASFSRMAHYFFLIFPVKLGFGKH